jgi:hypothetical protein
MHLEFVSKIVLRSENEDFSEWEVVLSQFWRFVGLKWKAVSCRWLSGQEGKKLGGILTPICIWLQQSFFFHRVRCLSSCKMHNGFFFFEEEILLFLCKLQVSCEVMRHQVSKYVRLLWLSGHGTPWALVHPPSWWPFSTQLSSHIDKKLTCE